MNLTIFKALFFILFCFSLVSRTLANPFNDPLSFYSSANQLFYALDPSNYSRNDYQWYLQNTGQDSILYQETNIIARDFGGNIDTEFVKAYEQGLISEIKTTKIALIDSGLFISHLDLQGNNFVLKNFSNTTNDFTDLSGHGTSTAGILFARENNIGLKGILNISTNNSIIFCKVSFLPIQVTKAIQYCISNNVKIINLPWGMPINDLSLSNTIAKAQEQGVVIVCATPNKEQNLDKTPDYPISWKFDNVVAVTSITREGERFQPSGYGKETVHLGAPGRIIATTGININYPYVYESGTSFACAIVAGCLVTIIEKYPKQNYKYWIERLLKGVDYQKDLTDITISGGRVNFVKPLLDDIPTLNYSFWDSNYSILHVAGYNNGFYEIFYSFDSVNWYNLDYIKGQKKYLVPSIESFLFFKAQLVN